MIIRYFLKVLLIFMCAVTALVTTAISLPYTSTQAADSPPECWGVFIGISTFDYLDDEVRYAAKGQQELYNRFSAAWGADHVKLLTDSGATKSSIMDAIAWLNERADDDDTVLFSVTSTGVAGPGADYYFWTYDSLPDSWDNDISSEELDTAFEAIDADGAVFILSFAHAGGFRNNLSGNNRIILAGCAENEWGYYDDSLENAVFMHYVIQALDNFSEADADNDYAVTAEEIFDYAASATIEFDESRGYLPAQQPVFSDHFAGKMPLIAQFALFNNVNLPAGSGITIDGTEHDILPVIFLTAPGSGHSVTVPEVIYITSDTRYAFDGWDDGEISATYEVLYGAYTVNYNKEYLLTINSAYGEPDGAGWYKEGAETSVSLEPSEGFIINYVFDHWTGDLTGNEAGVKITMDSPKVINAVWHVEYLHLYILLVVLVILIAGIILTIVLVVHHKRAKKPARKRKTPRRSAK